MTKGLEILEKIREQLLEVYHSRRLKNPHLFIACNQDIDSYVEVNYIRDIEKELAALKEMLALHDKWFKINEMSDYEFA